MCHFMYSMNFYLKTWSVEKRNKIFTMKSWKIYKHGQLMYNMNIYVKKLYK